MSTACVNCMQLLIHRVTLEDFYNFKSTADAFKCISKLMKGKIPKSLSKFLSKNVLEKEVQ